MSPWPTQVPFWTNNGRTGADRSGSLNENLSGDGTVVGAATMLVEFDEYDGGIWNGANDQASAFSFAWQPSSIYFALKVT